MNNLINAVKDELGRDEYLKQRMLDITNHGADSGFPGFSTYTETSDFFDNNKTAIIDLAKGKADELGEDLLEMIKRFCYLNGATLTEIAATIFGNEDNYYVKNIMSWLALEEVARYCVDNDEFADDEKGGE